VSYVQSAFKESPRTVTVSLAATVGVGDTVLAFVAANGSASITMPAGWTFHTSIIVTGRFLALYSRTRKVGDIGWKSATVTAAGNTLWVSLLLAEYSGVASIGYTRASGLTAPSLTAPAASTLVTWMAYVGLHSGTVSIPSGMTSRSSSNAQLPSYRLADEAFALAGSTGAKTSTGPTGAAASFSVILRPNSAPQAPLITKPATGSSIDKTVTNRFAWTFSDPDAGDSQAKFDLRYRVATTTAWTTASSNTPNNFWDASAGTFATGDYELQVRTYDALGAAGPYSTSTFFTVITHPTAPTITTPSNGTTVGQQESVTWSYPTQGVYQVRRVADVTGTADPTTVYYDSGQITTATARSALLTFTTNDRTEHVQVRIKIAGIWSTWADVTVDISYTSPVTPSLVRVTVLDALGAITVKHDIVLSHDQIIRKLGPRGWWKLNEPSGATSVADSSAHGHTGTVHGGVTFGQSGPISGNPADTGALFDGSTGYILTTGALSLGSVFSVGTWVNHLGASWSTGHEIVIGDNSRSYISVNNGHVFMSMSVTGVQKTLQGSAVPTTGWHFILISWDGSKMRTFLDLVPGTTLAEVGTSSGWASIELIGSLATVTTTARFKGVIAQAYAFNFVVTPAQMATIYDSIANPTGATTSYMNIYRSSAAEEEIRLATLWTPGADFTDYLPASGVDYTYRVEAVGTNGTTASASAR